MLRLGIRAIAGHDEISGTTRAGEDIAGLLAAVGQLCDMIDQTFSRYKERVVV